MRTRTVVLMVVCGALNVFAGWSAFHLPNWVTDAVTILIFGTVVGLLLNLIMHKGDCRFRGSAFTILGAYLAFMAFEIWRFYNYAD